MLFRSPVISGVTTLKFTDGNAWRINWGNEPLLSTISGILTIKSWADDRIGLIVAGRTSQTANIQEWQNGAGTAVVSISSSGTIVTRPTPFAGNQNKTIIGVTDTGNNWTQGSFRFISDSNGNPRFGFTAPNAPNESLTLKSTEIGRAHV